MGGYKSTTPADPNSWTHFCVHNNGSDDRESGWADNNPCISVLWADVCFMEQLQCWRWCSPVTFSTDNGATWHAPVSLTSASFIRDVQITGDPSGNGTIYIAGMDEGGGGFPHNNTNKIFRSTDGGNTWSNTYTGLRFRGRALRLQRIVLRLHVY